MESCEVLIVGGGPAGSACAWALRRAGMDVIVADGSMFPRDKVCAGWITPQIIEDLEIDRAEYATHRVLQPFTGFQVGVIGGGETTADYGHVISYGILRREFDHFLLERSGARLRLGERVRAARRVWGTWLVDDEIRAKMLVGAGGHFCPVSRRLPEGKGEPVASVMAQETEVWLSPDLAARCSTAPELPDLFFCRDLRGYGWCVRKGDYLNVGLGRLNEHHLPAHVEHFTHWLRETGRIPASLPMNLHGHAYSLYGSSPSQISGDGVLLVGDAAGLACDASGEGIRPAIESGLIAAQTIVEARGDYNAPQLRAYEARLQERFGRRARGISWGAGIPRTIATLAAEGLLSSRSFARHVVIDRWFLHRDLAPLPRPAVTDAPARQPNLKVVDAHAAI